MISFPKSALRVVTVVYALLLTVVSLLPSGGALGGWDEDISPSLQNLLHVPAYALLVVLAAAWDSSHSAGAGRIVLISLICWVFAMVLEVAQSWIPGRSASLADALFNSIGALVGCGILMGWHLTRRAPERPMAARPTASGTERTAQ